MPKIHTQDLLGKNYTLLFMGTLNPILSKLSEAEGRTEADESTFGVWFNFGQQKTNYLTY